jgi:hypothetical protein
MWAVALSFTLIGVRPAVADVHLRGADHRGDPAASMAFSYWAEEVRIEFARPWSVPKIPAEELKRLSSTVVLQVEEDGGVLSWKVRRLSGNALFDASVKSALTRLWKLPAMPPGARAFSRGWIALRFAAPRAAKESR